jgi:mannosyltransferase
LRTPRPIRPVAPETSLLQLGRQHWFWLVLATAVAALLRGWHLGTWSLWIDEAHTWRDATMPMEMFLKEQRVTYPLTFLLLRGLFGLGLGQDEASQRLPFVIIGVLTVPLVGICGRRLVGASAAVVAAWLLALNPWHVFWSQNARGYVVVVLAAVIAADRARAYTRTERVPDALAFAAAVLIGTLSHTTGALLFAGYLLFLLLRTVQRFDPRTVLRLVVAAAVVVYVLPWAIRQSGLFDDFLRSKGNASLLHFLQTTAYYFRPPTLVAAAFGLWLLRPVMGRDRTLLLGAMVVMPFLVLLAVGGQLAKATARYAICTLPMVLWLAAFAIVRLSQLLATAPTRALRIGAAVVLPIVLAGDCVLQLRDYHGDQHGHRPQWRAAVEVLQQRAAGRPLRVLTTSHPTLLYYLRPGHWAGQVRAPFGSNRVVALTEWMIAEGKDESEQVVCPPGVKAHFEWQRQQAKQFGALLAVAVTQPELAEVDHHDRLAEIGEHSAIRKLLASEFELIAHLPCWVGPKDESVSLYLPRQP